jgi:hypothetical protein
MIDTTISRVDRIKMNDEAVNHFHLIVSFFISMINIVYRELLYINLSVSLSKIIREVVGL